MKAILFFTSGFAAGYAVMLARHMLYMRKVTRKLNEIQLDLMYSKIKAGK